MTTATPYTRHARPGIPDAEELRARIPGWGVDVDPADRPAVPRELHDAVPAHAHWDVPDRQPEHRPRERSIEHAELTPVFGTSVPLRGLSGRVRRLAYARFSEGRAAHWLLLLAADRVDVVEQAAVAVVRGRPDNPLTETGIRAELSRHGWRSRVRRQRVDVRHHALDPIIVAGPWLVLGWLSVRLLRRVRATLSRH
jgi:hypothetical protein